MADIIQPTRTEPMFLKTDSLNPADYRLTIRWSAYIDSLGTSVNESQITSEAQLAGLETEIRTATSRLPKINKNIAEIDQLSTDLNKALSLIHALTKRVKELETKNEEFLFELETKNDQMLSGVYAMSTGSGPFPFSTSDTSVAAEEGVLDSGETSCIGTVGSSKVFRLL